MPVIAQGSGPMHGTLAVYWREPKAPTAEHFGLLDLAVSLAALAFERARMERQLLHQVSHDDLTGAANRALLRERLEQALARLRRGQLGDVALVAIDLRGFHAVNAEHGYAVGDQVLCEVADRLEATVREVDTVARFGADEFVVLAHTGDAGVLADRIRAALERPVTAAPGISLSCDIGVALAPRDATADQMLQAAEDALATARLDTVTPA
jgi:diguanylate cyclase (GGDEF)-like protein